MRCSSSHTRRWKAVQRMSSGRLICGPRPARKSTIACTAEASPRAQRAALSAGPGAPLGAGDPPPQALLQLVLPGPKADETDAALGRRYDELAERRSRNGIAD